MRLLTLFFAVSLATAMEAPPVKFATGFSNGKLEAHPHSGVELSAGGYFMVGDSLTSGESTAVRSQFAVKTDSKGEEAWQVALGDLGYNYGKVCKGGAKQRPYTTTVQ